MQTHDSSKRKDAAAASAGQTIWERARQSLREMQQGRDESAERLRLNARLARRASALRARLAPSQPEQCPIAFLAFSKGRQHYGVPLENVLDVDALHHFAVVPRAPAFLPGVTPWRGSMLTLLDLGRLYGTAEAGLEDVHFRVVVEAAGRRIGLVASKLDEVYSISPKSLAPAPSLNGETMNEAIAGVYENRWLILNIEQVLADHKLTDWMTQAV